MKKRLLAHRKEIMERLWDVEDRASSLGNAAVIEAARTTVRSLEALLAQCASDSNSLEVGRTWKYLGDALYVMFQKQDDQQCLERARHAYGRAEPLLSASGDILTYGKLQFNLGNALRLSKVAGEFSLTYLQEAKRRMLAAHEIFIELQPDGVATIEAALQQVDISLKAMSFTKWAKSDIEKIAELKSRLDGPGGDDPEVRAIILRELDEVSKDDQNEVGRLTSFVTGITPNSLSSASQKELLDRLAELAGLAGMRNYDIDKHFDEGAAELRRQMKGEVESGRITPGKMKALSQFLDDFERGFKQRSTKPEGMTVRAQEPHDLIGRFKHLQTEQESKRKRL